MTTMTTTSTATKLLLHARALNDFQTPFALLHAPPAAAAMALAPKLFRLSRHCNAPEMP
jgi:hypothetical protein